MIGSGLVAWGAHYWFFLPDRTILHVLSGRRIPRLCNQRYVLTALCVPVVLEFLALRPPDWI